MELRILVQLREKQPSWCLHELGNQAKDYVLEYLDANTQQSRAVPRRTQSHWSPPFEQNYKGNFAAAFFDDSSCAGIGVVFRDHMGQIIATPSQRIPLVQSMGLAEAMAARHALFCC